ncbi:hypothetical protein B0A48_11874 [Cryoendolithus antarcticus]|uniref:F-box domain-containing protein n=1 Tax=Cryoendolithus antarcticus TaxID=1507870 RepID=A0A1V8STD0_9PEZI|nr:hypothetical protein B0A48_11874 [Cryoendolithus antarcticus]
MPPRNEASLLGLPRELRDNIYAHVLKTDVDYQVAKDYTQRYGSQRYCDPSEHPKGPLREHIVPWTSLALVCRSVNDELSNYLHGIVEHGESRSNDLTTWTLDVKIPRRGIGAVTWRTLPCAPDDLSVLDVTIHAVEEIKFWGDGGPMGSVPCLYQLLNAILHCGPHLQWTHRLPQHLRLDEIRICVEGSGSPRYQTWTTCDDGEAETVRYGDNFSELKDLVGMLCGAGMLVGYVDVVRIFDGVDEIVEKLDKEWSTDNARVVPAHWDGYGFEWGSEGSGG